jgi:hypothetical protein
MEFLDHVVILFLIFWRTAILFSIVAIQFQILQNKSAAVVGLHQLGWAISVCFQLGWTIRDSYSSCRGCRWGSSHFVAHTSHLMDSLTGMREQQGLQLPFLSWGSLKTLIPRPSVHFSVMKKSPASAGCHPLKIQRNKYWHRLPSILWVPAPSEFQLVLSPHL